MKWYLITQECSFGMQHPQSIEKMYVERRILPVGTIIPEIWKGRHDIENLYLPKNYLVEWEPDESDFALLYMLWPQVRPAGMRVPLVENHYIGSAGSWVAAWYQIAHPKRNGLSSIPYGVSALMDIEGICYAGQTALVGDIVPAAFFAGLNNEQFDRLLRMGAVSLKWLAGCPEEYRAQYPKYLGSPTIERAVLSPFERDELLKTFPAMQAKDALVSQEPKVVIRELRTRKRN